MKSKSIILWVVLSCLALSPSAVDAQATGYMGLRNAFGYECNFLPILQNNLFGRLNPANPSSNFTVLNGHSITYERFVKRKSTIMLEAQYRRFGTLESAHEFANNVTIPSHYKMQSMAYRFRFKVFPLNHRGLLAPLGPYLELISGFSHYGGTLITANPTYNGSVARGNALDLGFGFGQHWVAADRILVDFGFKFVFPARLNTSGFLTFQQDYRPARAHFSSEGANFKLGIAYMVRDPRKTQ